MKAVVLAAGKGTRLRPLTQTTPKPLLDLCGEPLIRHVFTSLPDEIQEIFLVVNYLKDQIIESIGEQWQGIPINYIVQEPLTGTGGALHCLKGKLQERFLVVNGDDLYAKADLEHLLEYDLGILVHPTQKDIGASALLDGQGCFVGLESGAPKHETKLQVCGAYVLDERFFKYELVKITTNGRKEFGLPQTLVGMSRDCRIQAEFANFWMPVGTPQQLAMARSHCAKLTNM